MMGAPAIYTKHTPPVSKTTKVSTSMAKTYATQGASFTYTEVAIFDDARGLQMRYADVDVYVSRKCARLKATS